MELDREQEVEATVKRRAQVQSAHTHSILSSTHTHMDARSHTWMHAHTDAHT